MNKTTRHPIILLLFFIAYTASALSGKVMAVKDGDTFVLLTEDNKQINIRLNGIDCPEKAQPFGIEAKQFVSDLILEKQIEVDVSTIDRYGRTVGTVFLKNVNINQALVESGYAWWYRQYAPNDRELEKLEEKARRNHSGLWVDSNPTAPWDFRHGVRNRHDGNEQMFIERQPDRDADATASVTFNTETKKYHCPTCKWAVHCSDNCISIDLQGAQNREGIPCKVCGGTCR